LATLIRLGGLAIGFAGVILLTARGPMAGDGVIVGGVALVNARIGQRRLFGRRAVAEGQAGRGRPPRLGLRSRIGT